jgi:signal transduction histidine kinase
MKLISRLTLYLLLVIGVAFAVDATLSVRADLALFEADVQRDERILGQAFGLAVERVWSAQGRERALALIAETNQREDVVRIRLVRLDAEPGDPFAPGAPGLASRAVARDRTVAHVRDEGETSARLFTYVPLSVPDEAVAALEITESLSHERSYTATRVRRTLVTAGIAALVCGLVAWAVGIRVVGRPIAELVEKARRVGAGDFSGPVVPLRRDELGLVARELNAMAEGLTALQARVAAESGARIAALEQLRHADRLTTVGKLASGLAHELGTPLNVVAGRAKMIASGEAVDPEEVTDCARIIGEQSERMTRIVRQLLDFARRRSPEKVATDLAQLARQTVALLEPLAAKRGVRLACEDTASPALAPLDKGQLQQALTNLVVNAIQATKPAGRVRVRALREAAAPGGARADRPGAFAVLEVSDEGEGIPAERLPAIFDPFFTTKPVDEGTGLGLSVAHGIVQEHGGWIDVESEPGRGSCFRIWLPAEPA